MAGYVLDGVRYEYADLGNDVPVREQIRVERWLRTAGISDARTFEDLLAIVMEVNSMATLREQMRHPESKLAFSLGLWAARRIAGDKVTLDDCLGWTWNTLGFYDDDHAEVSGSSLGKDQAP